MLPWFLWLNANWLRTLLDIAALSQPLCLGGSALSSHWMFACRHNIRAHAWLDDQRFFQKKPDY